MVIGDLLCVCERDMLRSGGRNGDLTGGSKDVDTYVCVERNCLE